MHNAFKIFVSTFAALAVSATSAFAGTLSALGGTVPIAEGGILGLVAAGVVGGIWLARRKR